MKSSAEILREHIDLVRRVDEGLVGSAMGAIGGALAGGLSSWFNRKDTSSDAVKPGSSTSKSSANKSSISKSSSDDDEIDVGNLNTNSAKSAVNNDPGGGNMFGRADRLGYTPGQYVPQGIIPVGASSSLPEGGSRYERALKAITSIRGGSGMVLPGDRPVSGEHVFVKSWNCQGACILLHASGHNYQSAFNHIDTTIDEGSPVAPAFTPLGLQILNDGSLGIESNRFGPSMPAELITLVSIKNPSKLLNYAIAYQIVPFRTDRGPGLRQMHLSYLGPKAVWDGEGEKHFRAIWTSFHLANGAQELQSKD